MVEQSALVEEWHGRGVSLQVCRRPVEPRGNRLVMVGGGGSGLTGAGHGTGWLQLRLRRIPLPLGRKSVADLLAHLQGKEGPLLQVRCRRRALQPQDRVVRFRLEDRPAQVYAEAVARDRTLLPAAPPEREE